MWDLAGIMWPQTSSSKILEAVRHLSRVGWHIPKLEQKIEEANTCLKTPLTTLKVPHIRRILRGKWPSPTSHSPQETVWP